MTVVQYIAGAQLVLYLANFSTKLSPLRYDMMLSCWEKKASERPKFSDLVITVSDLLERDDGYPELLVSIPNTLSSSLCIVRPEPELTELAVVEPDWCEKSGSLSSET